MKLLQESQVSQKQPEGSNWTENMINVEVIGSPQKEVVNNARGAISRTLNEMGFRGSAPKVVVSEGEVVSETTGEPFIACYDWQAKPPTIRIGQAGLKRIWESLQVDVPDKISVMLAASEETVHYVQDQEGRLPHKGNKATIDQPQLHYKDEHEREARPISFKVTNDMLGYTFIRPK